jgi:hypothetical protein
MYISALEELLAEPPAHRAPDTVEIVHGSTVLLTAPHAVAHARHAAPTASGERKKHDRATGQMVEVLARTTGAAALIARPPWTGNANADPLELCPFKQAVVRLIDTGSVRSVLDIHGMSAGHGMDVCVGNGGVVPDRSTGELGRLLDEAGLTWALNVPFPGRGQGTVRSAATAAGAFALQLELAPRCRDPHRHPGSTEALFGALAQFVLLQG